MATFSQSLVNMSVATDNAGTNQTMLMPKLQFRFRVLFSNLGVANDSGLFLTQQVVECKRPTVNFAEVNIPIYNSTIKLAGKHTWQDITITVRDDSSGTVSEAVGQQLQKQLDFVEQASAATGQDYKFQTNIEILDGGNGGVDPVVLESWELYGCFLGQVDYQSLNYGTSDPVTIQMTIRYDNAVQSFRGIGSIQPDRGNPEGVATGIGDNLGGFFV